MDKTFSDFDYTYWVNNIFYITSVLFYIGIFTHEVIYVKIFEKKYNINKFEL